MAAERRARDWSRAWRAVATSLWLPGVGLLAVLSLLSVAGWVELRQIERLRETARLVAHTHRTLAELNRLQALAEEVESSSRGFVITGETRFAEAFDRSIAAVEVQQGKLRALLADEVSRAELTILDTLLAERIAIARENVALRRESGFEAARAAVAGGLGVAKMDAVRASVAALASRRQQLLEEREERAESEVARTRAWVVLSMGMGAVVLAVASGLLWYQVRERRRLANERDRFFELSLDLLCVASTDGTFKRVSPAFTATLGYPAAVMEGRPYLDFIHPDDHDAVIHEVDRLASGQKLLHFVNRYRCQDGSWRSISWQARPATPEGLIFASGRDVTEQQAAAREIENLNEQLSRRAEELEAANRELETFSYSVSHDLRAPLRHVQGYIEMLTTATAGQLAGKPLRYLDTIRAASVEMGHLIDDLLAFSRMGRADLREQVVAVEELAQSVIAGLAEATRDRQIGWRIGPLPAVHGDSAMLKVVLTNLLDNAVKFTRHRDQAVIEIGSAGEEAGRAILFVRDNGAGFDMQYVDKLFGVFQRLHRSEEFEGTGIGLATARRIIARHGGRTWAEGAPDRGATIYFTLRLVS